MAKPRKRENGGVEPPASQSAGTESSHYEHNDRARVAERAYELYIARGAGHGQDMDDWLAAEREVSGRERHNGSER